MLTCRQLGKDCCMERVRNPGLCECNSQVNHKERTKTTSRRKVGKGGKECAPVGNLERTVAWGA
eukprot:2833549-Rhodomonas_salina.1